ncbi:phosphodiester glycosidase family protein [Candidatus Gracilibacteria bacterium]|nr:phosphodiester glycosidase family protein [Candidatus Gracilibacteria bacterium]
MKKILFLLLIIIPNYSFANTYIEQNLYGYKMKVIEYDISSLYNLKFIKSTQTDERSLKDLLQENNAITGVNGAFFCPGDYSFCKNKVGTTNNERIIEGEFFEGHEFTMNLPMFSIDKDKNSFIYQKDYINGDKFDKIYYGLSNWPLLLQDGNNMLQEYYDLSMIDNKMKVKGTRNFICNNKEKSKIYFGLVYSATIDELAGLLKDFGCSDALNLDAGLSTAFIYNSRYIVGPQRNIIDAIGIERDGLVVKDLNNLGEKITNIILKDIEKKSGKNKNTKRYKKNYDKLLSKYILSLEELRKNIYSKYSSDIFQTNIVGEKDIIGYKIDLNDLNSLKLVNLVNIVYSNLKAK